VPDPLRRLFSRLDGGPVFVSAEERRDLNEDGAALAAAGVVVETTPAAVVECASCDEPHSAIVFSVPTAGRPTRWFHHCPDAGRHPPHPSPDGAKRNRAVSRDAWSGLARPSAPDANSRSEHRPFAANNSRRGRRLFVGVRCSGSPTPWRLSGRTNRGARPTGPAALGRAPTPPAHPHRQRC